MRAERRHRASLTGAARGLRARVRATPKPNSTRHKASHWRGEGGPLHHSLLLTTYSTHHLLLPTTYCYSPPTTSHRRGEGGPCCSLLTTTHHLLLLITYFTPARRRRGPLARCATTARHHSRAVRRGAHLVTVTVGDRVRVRSRVLGQRGEARTWLGLGIWLRTGLGLCLGC